MFITLCSDAVSEAYSDEQSSCHRETTFSRCWIWLQTYNCDVRFTSQDYYGCCCCQATEKEPSPVDSVGKLDELETELELDLENMKLELDNIDTTVCVGCDALCCCDGEHCTIPLCWLIIRIPAPALNSRPALKSHWISENWKSPWIVFEKEWKVLKSLQFVYLTVYIKLAIFNSGKSLRLTGVL